MFSLFGCSSKEQGSVVVYVSEDQIFSEPILHDFERFHKGTAASIESLAGRELLKSF